MSKDGWEHPVGISSVQEEKDGVIYFVFRSRSGRFVECMVEYNEEDDEVLLRGNDHVYGRI